MLHTAASPPHSIRVRSLRNEEKGAADIEVLAMAGQASCRREEGPDEVVALPDGLGLSDPTHDVGLRRFIPDLFELPDRDRHHRTGQRGK